MVDLFQRLLILQCICGSIGSFYDVTLCEKKSLNISCDNGTEIKIQHIQFGPLNPGYRGNQESGRVPTLNETDLEVVCNNISYCYLNGSDIFQFDAYPYIQRLKKHVYKCDFEYLGCYEDNVQRLFTGPGIKYGDYMPPWKQNMSALICRNFCSMQGNYPYFGTENEWECYCGFENDSKKLNTTSNGASYYWHETQDCSTNCAQHTYEKCGRSTLLSTYTTKTAHLEKLLPMNEIPKESCRFNSSINSLFSWQIAKHCEKEEIFNPTFYDCNENSCWVKELQPFVPDNLDYYLPKYVTVNYSCKDHRNNKIQYLASEHMSQNSKLAVIVVGCVAGICLLIGLLFGYFMYKRNYFSKIIQLIHQTKNSSALPAETQYNDLELQSSDNNYDDLSRQHVEIENNYNNDQTVTPDHTYYEIIQ